MLILILTIFSLIFSASLINDQVNENEKYGMPVTSYSCNR